MNDVYGRVLREVEKWNDHGRLILGAPMMVSPLLQQMRNGETVTVPDWMLPAPLRPRSPGRLRGVDYRVSPDGSITEAG
ncbi:hypothetical protein [Mycolicibacterium septicum]|uniref:hypothetical protein n=1 Tax=Mycolicibacterium septicum TaxID=98668 RepID=UPI001AFA18A9|nr:hypothetical protein [Mycolicibacterium septicum]QRY53392.1 hypothetical protein JVX95_08765 [Mycolicibacterium septicum]